MTLSRNATTLCCNKSPLFGAACGEARTLPRAVDVAMDLAVLAVSLEMNKNRL